MHNSPKKFRDPWTNAVTRLRRAAKKQQWPLVSYYDCGYRVGYLKTKGNKWVHIAVLRYRDGKYKPITKKYTHNKFLGYI